MALVYAMLRAPFSFRLHRCILVHISRLLPITIDHSPLLYYSALLPPIHDGPIATMPQIVLHALPTVLWASAIHNTGDGGF